MKNSAEIQRASDGVLRGKSFVEESLHLFHGLQTIHDCVNLEGHSFIRCLRNQKRQAVRDGPTDHHHSQAQICEQMDLGRICPNSETFQNVVKETELLFTK